MDDLTSAEDVLDMLATLVARRRRGDTDGCEMHANLDGCLAFEMDRLVNAVRRLAALAAGPKGGGT